MKVLVIGGVAAGTKVAAKLKRVAQDCNVTILTKSNDISYAGCGLPYYIGHVIEDEDQLIVNTPEKYTKLTGVEVKNNTEVIKVDTNTKKVTAKDVNSEEISTYAYDSLVICSGASANTFNLNVNFKNVFTVRSPEDAINIRNYIGNNDVKKAVVVGGGYIGLEVAENLKSLGIRPFVLEMASEVLQPAFDIEMSKYIKNRLIENGIPVVTNVKVTGIEGNEKAEKVVTDKKQYKTDIVILCAGIKANTSFLDGTEVTLINSKILTDRYGETNVKDVYAVGDCALVHNIITGKSCYSPMGSTANIVGRIVAQNIVDKHIEYNGVLQTAVCKLAGFNVARTGLTEMQAKENGFDPITVISITDDKAHYYPGSDSFIIKLIADKQTERLLGLQVIGKGAVDKINDVAVTAITLKAKVRELNSLDLSYAPPFSTAINPFSTAMNVLINKIDGTYNTFTPVEYEYGAADNYQIIDTCLKPSIENAPYIDLLKVNGPLEDFNENSKLLLVCNKGKRAYLLQNRLKKYGYTNTKVLEGGITFNNIESR